MRESKILYALGLLGLALYFLRGGSADPGPTSNEEFEKAVRNPSGFVLVKFTATWCGPCRMLEPQLERLEQKMQGQLTVVRVDIDKNRDLSLHYNVRSVPTLVLFNEGEMVDKMLGGRDATELQQWIEQPRSLVAKTNDQTHQVDTSEQLSSFFNAAFDSVISFALSR